MNKYLFLTPAIFFFSCAKHIEKKTYVPRVETSTVIEKTIPIGLDAVGHCTAYNSAMIKAQVEGVLEKLHYKEGEIVEKGSPLFTIDPRPYAATLDKQIAVRAENVAQLKYNAEKLIRYEPLLADDYVSKLEFDSLIKNVEEYEALVMQSDADILLAEIDLDYCYIKAPFTGVAGKKTSRHWKPNHK